jgi:hypothetical protein
MTGVRREWITSNNFVMLHLDLVDALGGSYEAAALLNRIQYRAGDGWWVVTKAEMAADIRLSEWKMDRAIKELRDAGMVESERVDRFHSTLRWRLCWAPEEDSSFPGTGDTSLPTHPEEDSSLSGEEDSSFSSSKNIRTTVQSGTHVRVDEAPERHPQRQITNDWTPANGFKSSLCHDYPLVNVDAALRRFVDHHIGRGDTNRSWEAEFRKWVSLDQDRLERDREGGTDDLGIPYNQRKTSIVGDGRKPGEEGYVDPQELIEEARQMGLESQRIQREQEQERLRIVKESE